MFEKADADEEVMLRIAPETMIPVLGLVLHQCTQGREQLRPAELAEWQALQEALLGQLSPIDEREIRLQVAQWHAILNVLEHGRRELTDDRKAARQIGRAFDTITHELAKAGYVRVRAQ